MKDIINELRKVLEEEGEAALATIIKQGGSSPRGLGTSCIFRKDRSVIGTIGGGRLEAQTADAAVECLSESRPRRIHFSLKGSDVTDTEMLCGGEVEVFIEPMTRGQAGLDSLMDAVEATLKGGGAGVLVTILEGASTRACGTLKAFFAAKGGMSAGLDLLPKEVQGALMPEFEQVLRKSTPVTLTAGSPEGKPLELFLEPFIGKPHLYIFGAGHVSRQVAPLAARVGFKVVVTDDRSEFADPKAFPDASEVLTIPFETVMDHIDLGDGAFVVIVTRGHAHDREVLAQALRTDARYVGMIGSRRKRDAIYRSLLEDGFTEKDLQRVHCPIGLEIGAETPEEIAVSIVAELIKVRAGKE